MKAAAWGEESMRVTFGTLERRGVTVRPYPPDECGDEMPETFLPAPTFAEWIRDTFIAASGPLANEGHEHLIDARIGVLWTNAINQRHQRLVLATAEIPVAMGGGWKRARHDYQLRQWFDAEPDFLLTFSAPDCARLDDRAFCALVDHELRHCAQAEDAHGSPRFNQQTGAPIFALRGHDSEEFIGTARLFGRAALGKGTRDLIDAANLTPLFQGDAIDIACGTCR